MAHWGSSALSWLQTAARRSTGGSPRHRRIAGGLAVLALLLVAAATLVILIPRPAATGLRPATAAQSVPDTLSQPCGTGLRIQMFSATTGWTYSAYRPDPVWHTTTGGATWDSAGPSAAKGSVTVAACFVSGNQGWVVTAPPRFGSLQVWETTEGGHSWAPLSQVEIPDSLWPVTALGGLAPSPVALPVLDFASRNTGWLWLPGSSATGGRLLGTENGGRSWGALPEPPAGTQSDLWLVTPALGFDLSGKPGAELGLWATHDGGRDWSRVSSLQCGMGTTCTVVLSRPAFASASEGVLLAVTEPDIDRLLTYATHDGGRNWSRVGPPLLLKTGFPTPVDQATRSLSVLMAATASQHGSQVFALLRSSDRDRAWIPTASRGLGPGIPLSNVSFATSGIGWVWMAASGVHTPGPGPAGPALFATSDGGSVWHQVRVPARLSCTALPTAPPSGQDC